MGAGFKEHKLAQSEGTRAGRIKLSWELQASNVSEVEQVGFGGGNKVEFWRCNKCSL